MKNNLNLDYLDHEEAMFHQIEEWGIRNKEKNILWTLDSIQEVALWENQKCVARTFWKNIMYMETTDNLFEEKMFLV